MTGFTDEELIEIGKRSVDIVRGSLGGVYDPEHHAFSGLIGFVFHTLLEQEKEKRKP